MRTVVQFIDKLTAGGKERQCAELTKWLSGRGDYMTYVVSLAPGLFFTELESLPRVSVVYLPRRTRRDPTVFFRFLVLCWRWRPSSITAWHPMTALYAIPAAKILGIKLVAAVIQDAPAVISGKLRMRSRIVFAVADAIVGNSLAGIRAYDPPADKTTLIRAGYDLARNDPAPDAGLLRRAFPIRQRYVVGMVAAFSAFKDQPTLIEAARIVLKQRRDVAFVMVGGGPTLEHCRGLVTPDERDDIRFLGEVELPVEQIVDAFDIGALVTFTEGISNSIIEYMIRRKPVVATEGGGTPELVVDGVTGFLVKQRRPEQLAAVLIRLLDAPELRTRMGDEGRKRIEQEFLLPHTVARYCDLYDRLTVRDKDQDGGGALRA